LTNEKQSILIVDDSKLVVQAIAKTLKPKNYNISYALDGQSALDAIKKNKPDMIILDVEMPVMDGYKTIKHIKENNDTLDIPVIFLTSIIKPEAIKKVFDLGAADYITKPFVDEELIARIEKELNTLRLQQSLKEKMSRVADAMSHDSLTRVYNRLYLTSLLNRQMKKLDEDAKGSFSLIYIDIDHFNSFNSIHGLKNSDNALHKFATIIKNSIRENDILSRWEGDRFLIYLPLIPKEQLLVIAKKILDNIEKTTFSSSTNLTAGLTLLMVSKMHNLDDMIKTLQEKMCDAKALGRNSMILVEES